MHSIPKLSVVILCVIGFLKTVSAIPATLAPPLPPTKVVAAAARGEKLRYYSFKDGQGSEHQDEIGLGGDGGSTSGGSYGQGRDRNAYSSGDPFEVPSLAEIGDILRQRDEESYGPRPNEHRDRNQNQQGDGWGWPKPTTRPPSTKGWGWSHVETTTQRPTYGWSSSSGDHGGSRYGVGSYGNDKKDDDSSRYWGWHDDKTTTPRYNPKYLSSDEEKYRPIRYPTSSFVIGGSGGWSHGDGSSDSGYGRPSSSLWSSAAASQSGGYGKGSYSSSWPPSSSGHGSSWGQNSPSRPESSKGHDTPYRRESNENYNYRPTGDTGWGSEVGYPNPKPSPPSWVDRDDSSKDGWGWPKPEPIRPPTTHGWGWTTRRPPPPTTTEGWGWSEPTRPPRPPTTTEGWGWPEPTRPPRPITTTEGWGWPEPTRPPRPPTTTEGWGWPEPTRPPRPPPTTEGWGWPEPTRAPQPPPTTTEGWGWPKPEPTRPSTKNSGWGRSHETLPLDAYERPDYPPGLPHNQSPPGESDNYPSFDEGDFPSQPNHYRIVSYTPSPEEIAEMANRPPVGGWERDEGQDTPSGWGRDKDQDTGGGWGRDKDQDTGGGWRRDKGQDTRGGRGRDKGHDTRGEWGRDKSQRQDTYSTQYNPPILSSHPSSFSPSYGNNKGQGPPPQGNNKGAAYTESGSESNGQYDKWFTNNFHRTRTTTTTQPPPRPRPKAKPAPKSTPRPFETMVRKTFSTSKDEGMKKPKPPVMKQSSASEPKPQKMPSPKSSNSDQNAVTEGNKSSKKTRYDEHGFKYIPYNDPNPMAKNLASSQKDIYESLDYTNGGEKRDKGGERFGEASESRYWGHAIPQPWSRRDPIDGNSEPFVREAVGERLIESIALDSERRSSKHCPLGQIYSKQHGMCMEPRIISVPEQTTTMKSRISLFK